MATKFRKLSTIFEKKDLSSNSLTFTLLLESVLKKSTYHEAHRMGFEHQATIQNE